MAHFCINCPYCRGGCSLCGRCACSPAQVDERNFKCWASFMQITNVTPLVTPPDDDMPQLPETD